MVLSLRPRSQALRGTRSFPAGATLPRSAQVSVPYAELQVSQWVHM